MGAMKRPSRPVQRLLALGVPVAATGIAWLLDGSMSLAGLAMAYLVAVVAAALVLDRLPALASALLSVLALNFFFVPPRWSFAVAAAESWWILAVLLGLSLALGELLARLRERSERAHAGEQRAAQLHALSETLAGCTGDEAMAQAAARWLHAELGLPAAVFLRHEAQGQRTVCAGAQLDAFDARAAAWAIDHARAIGPGCDDWSDLPLWCAPFVPAGSGGAVQLLVARDRRPPGDELRHRLALVRQVGLSIERERAGRAAREALEGARAEAARNTLLASLAHDLRTPLAAILGSASTLRTQRPTLTARQQDELLRNLEDETRAMGALADNILQMARLSQPHAQLRLQWESLEEVLGATAARLRRRWPQARIEVRVAADLPPVRAEAALLAQLLANLVDNAVRHGGKQPHIVLQAGRSREGVFFAVRDHGAGLPAGDPQELFGRYGGSGAGGGGAGLGLAICRLVAQAHGGRIEARRCEPGAEFRVDLPAPPEQVIAHGPA